MKKMLSIIRYTFIENVRNKIFYVLVLFGVIVVGASLLLAALGGEQARRIVLDLGLGAIEFFALLTVGFAAVTLVLEEMESKTIYLILTRPVSRMTYLSGRYLGLLAAVFAGMAVMALFHLGLLWLRGWEFTWRYPLALFLSAEKIMVIGSVALFFSLFSTSAISSLSFTLFFWLLGHFSAELYFLSTKLTGLLPQLAVKVVYYLIPNMQYFNLRDFWDVPYIAGGWIAASVVYGLLYSSFLLALSLWMFRYKEF
jgi:ABC-type transport system involved in multi-copper enzyme maturation permease subunit